MNFESAEVRKIKDQLRNLDIFPKNFFGQNFLIDKEALSQIIAVSNLSSEDCVVEIGAGLGVLTEELAKTAREVIAFERDRVLANFLRINFKDKKNVKIINEDFLKTDYLKMIPFEKKYKIVANIPYNITGKILRKLFSVSKIPSLIVILVQKEVAERIVSGPGKMSLLSASIQLYGKPSIVLKVEATSFYPSPKVDSAVVVIEPYEIKLFSAEEERRIFTILRIGFSSRRKTLLNNLSAGLKIKKAQTSKILESNRFPATARAQELSIEQWRVLAESFKSIKLEI